MATDHAKKTAPLWWPAARMPAAAALVAMLIAPALAETRTVERTAKAVPGKDLRIGVYINLRPDCSSGPLPSIRLSAPPPNGTVTVRQGKVTATNYKQCLAMTVPAYVAVYRSKPEFRGADALELEVKYANGRVEIQRFRIVVGTTAREEPI